MSRPLKNSPVKPPKLTAVSLFSGCGGFDLGAERAGVEIIWANDIDPAAASAYRKLLPKVHFEEGDIRTIKEFPKADILIGCYPCTGFSEAAKRRNSRLEKRNLKANEGNFLFREFLRALDQIRPKYLFVENVQGMLSAEDGWFFKQQIEGFENLGYEIKHKLLNAQDFGVAQSRKRLFLVGVHKSVSGFEYEFPSETHGPGRAKPHITLGDILSSELRSGDSFWDGPFHGHYLTRNRKRSWNETSFTIVAHADHVPLHPTGKPMKNIGVDQWELQGTINRRLSWKECLQIQGLPLRTYPNGTLREKYRVVGNAVPPTFGEILVRPIISFESSLSSKD
jgi:DNA (cytosine-5)-methyltransferase 1